MKIYDRLLIVVKVLIVVCLTIIFGMFLKTKTILNHNFYVVNGNSMYPTLKNDDFLVARKTTSVDVGDIICFEQNDKLIVHRIIYKNGNVIITKGDFNELQDEKISINQIKGKVVYKSTLIGFIFKNLHIIILFLIGFICVKFFELKNDAV